MSKIENCVKVETSYTPSLLRLKRNLYEALSGDINAVDIQNAVDTILANTDFEIGAEMVANTAYEVLIDSQDGSS